MGMVILPIPFAYAGISQVKGQSGGTTKIS
ncbi:hypothetical protein XBO1_1300054 [Xenorhabdus bovienii str. oregonense]|uniref:Uncharacterized protein n=2 Tax=Xenorhabdus bovienii TaxID=40576 RepID=A0A077QDB4_XENBV|nr:hypothetical protein XBO1_1300054 [Xenorhabdus bovienii str. oregonense]CDH31090.1 hypothetical protein XBI1_1260111 [Xenorhabdus bovienii str. Intermedium]